MRAASQDCSSVFLYHAAPRSDGVQTACWSWWDVSPSLSCRDQEGQLSLLGLSNRQLLIEDGPRGHHVPVRAAHRRGGQWGVVWELRARTVHPVASCDAKKRTACPVP